MSSSTSTGLVAPSDIAELAGVTRAAVSNWRKRRADFPEPAGGTVAKPLFNRSSVENWLVANGHKLRRDSGELAVWALINRFRDAVPIQAARPLVQLVLCARKIADGSDDLDVLSRAARQNNLVATIQDKAQSLTPDPRLAGLLSASLEMLRQRSGDVSRSEEAIERLAGELFVAAVAVEISELGAVSDYALARFGAAEGRMAGEHGVVGSKISQLLADAAGDVAGIAYDPACGIGEALLQLWTKSPNKPRLHLVGSDISTEAVLIAKQRCFLHDADATIDLANVLGRDPSPGLLADVIVAEPPFGMAMPPGFNLTDARWALAGPPPKSNSETAWLQHIIAHLAPEGRGFIVTGNGSTFNAASAQIRRSLVRARCVEAVIALPPKLLLHTAISTALWVVRSPGASTGPGRVTFLDVSDRDPSEELPIHGWLANPEKYDDLSWARPSLEEVLADDEVNLSPRHWLQVSIDVDAVTDQYEKASSELRTAIASLNGHRTLRVVNPSATPHTVSVRALEKQGAVHITQARSKPRRDRDEEDDVQDPSIVTTRMIREGLPDLPERLLSIEESPAASQFDIPTVDYNVTEPGDVLLSTMRTIRAVVDPTGGRTLSSGVIRLRIDQNQLNPHYVAECLAASWNQSLETGNYIPHANVRDLQIPLIPIDEQIRVTNYLDEARRISSAGRVLISAADRLAGTQLDAIRFDLKLVEEDDSLR